MCCLLENAGPISAVGLGLPYKRKPTNAVSNPGEVESVTRYAAALGKLLWTACAYVDPAVNGFRQTYSEICGK